MESIVKLDLQIWRLLIGLKLWPFCTFRFGGEFQRLSMECELARHWIKWSQVLGPRWTVGPWCVEIVCFLKLWFLIKSACKWRVFGDFNGNVFQGGYRMIKHAKAHASLQGSTWFVPASIHHACHSISMVWNWFFSPLIFQKVGCKRDKNKGHLHFQLPGYTR